VCRWYIDVDNGDRSQRRSDVDGLAFHVRRTTSFCVDESITDKSDETTSDILVLKLISVLVFILFGFYSR